MLSHWLFSLSDQFSVLNVFRYITFKSFISFFTAFFVCWFIGPYFIKRMQQKQVKQNVRKDGPETHYVKQGTPTMGGVLIMVSILVSALLWMDVTNVYMLSVLTLTLSFGLIGYFDDALTIKHKSSKGLPGKLRLILEFTISFCVIGFLVHTGHLSTELHIPFFKNVNFELGYFYILFGGIVTVGCANAVNFTDGLDGLAIVPVIICSGTFALFAYIAGHYEIADYLNIPHIAGAGALTPLAVSIIAAGLGFLWYNAYPAQVFMGDVGSLGLGGFLGVMAVVTKNELLLLVLGGVFVVEALSVITQVMSYKLTGKRVFKMAPIHHHFELKGLVENKIIVRFWIISILLAVLCLSTLKLR